MRVNKFKINIKRIHSVSLSWNYELKQNLGLRSIFNNDRFATNLARLNLTETAQSKYDIVIEKQNYIDCTKLHR